MNDVNTQLYIPEMQALHHKTNMKRPETQMVPQGSMRFSYLAQTSLHPTIENVVFQKQLPSKEKDLPLVSKLSRVVIF